jgi:hypothetical protein
MRGLLKPPQGFVPLDKDHMLNKTYREPRVRVYTSH